jgi:hypothetical protein
MQRLSTHGLIGGLTLLVAGSAAANTILFEDDFSRGWENAMTHTNLPAWSEPGTTFVPPTNLTPWEVDIVVDGNTVDVVVNGSVIASATDPDLTPGHVGVFSWANRGPLGSIFGPLTVTEGAATAYTENWLTDWRSVPISNSDGATSDLGISIGKRFFEPRIVDDTNFFTVATTTAPNTDFRGPGVVYAVPGAESWADYTVQTRILNTDDDGIGLLLYVTPTDDFYRLMFTSEVTVSGSWAPTDRAPQGLSVQKYKDGAWTQLYREDAESGGTPLFVYTPGVPFDVTATISTDDGTGDVSIDLEVVDDPDGAANLITYPTITDSSDPIAAGAPGLAQWGSSGCQWLSYGGVSTPFATAADTSVLVDDIFSATTFGDWTQYDNGSATPRWQLSLAGAAAYENSNAIPTQGAIFEPFVIVDESYTTASSYVYSVDLASDDNDGIGLVFGFEDLNNYWRVGFRAQGGTGFGFPQGTGIWKTVDGVTTPVVTVRPPRGNVHGIWLTKLPNRAIENVFNRGLSDGSGKDGVEFQGPRIAAGDVNWTDYTYEATIKARDNDGLGLLFRYQDELNHYRLTFASEEDLNPAGPAQGVTVQKVKNGTYSELFRDTTQTVDGGFTYDPLGTQAGESIGFAIFRVRVITSGGDFTVEVDGYEEVSQQWFENIYTASFSDGDPIANGKIGVHTWFHSDNEFSALSVTPAGDSGPAWEWGFGEPDPKGWEDVTAPTLGDPLNFVSITHSESPDPNLTAAGVTFSPDFGIGSFMGAGDTVWSGLGLRLGVDGAVVRDNRWASGTVFAVPDNPETPDYDPDLTRGTIDWEGPRIVAGADTWTDYTYSVDLQNLDDDGIGILFRYQDEDNFYRVSFQHQAGNTFGAAPRGVAVQKKMGGTWSEVFFSDDFVYTPRERWNVAITAIGGDFELTVTQLYGDVDGDGQTTYTWNFSDSEPITTGQIGLTCWGSNAGIGEADDNVLGTGLGWTEIWDGGAQFFDVLVTEPGSDDLVGDTNCDGAVDFFDIDPFVTALVSGQGTWEAEFDCDFVTVNDINGDGNVDFFDIDPFVGLLVE